MCTGKVANKLTDARHFISGGIHQGFSVTGARPKRFKNVVNQPCD